MTGFWAGRRVLVTGHTGFKGAWLSMLLARSGARVTGVALPANTSPNLHELARIDEIAVGHLQDIRDAEGLALVVRRANPEIVFHLAAQPLVRESYRQPLETISTNVLGTANLLEALRIATDLRAVVVVTTDKVYRNRERREPYCEDDTLGGRDPYSASKAACELIVASYRDSFFAERAVGVATARAGNVIGGGDWSAERLVPDAVRAWSNGETLRVRRPRAIRPWQHVLEPLSGYLQLAEGLVNGSVPADAYNFGPYSGEAVSVRDIVELARAEFGTGDVEWGGGDEGPHEAGLLALDTSKSRQVLGYKPRWDVQTAVRRTFEWYRRQARQEAARELCAADLAAFDEAGQTSGSAAR